MITQPTDLLSKNLKLLQISSHVILKILMQIKLGRKKIYNKYLIKYLTPGNMLINCMSKCDG